MLRFIRAISENPETAARFSGNAGQITRENARLSPSQAAAFNKRLLALMDEFRGMAPPAGEQGDVYSLTFVFTPTLNEALPPTDVTIEPQKRHRKND
jgi:hypothetical protein